MKEPSDSGRTAYLGVLGLADNEKKKQRKAALDRSHEIRFFEIDLYWKRANYFWLLQAAVFTAVALTIKSGKDLFFTLVPLALSSLGFLTAWASFLAALSSKFWQRNWEHHIDVLEGEFEGNLYKTVYVSRSGSRWSLTSVNEKTILFFSMFWIVILIFTSITANPNWHVAGHFVVPNLTESFTVILWLSTACGAYLLTRQKTGVSGERISYPESMADPGQGSDAPQLFGTRIQPYLVRREPGIENVE